jgi:hypothetical protein
MGNAMIYRIRSFHGGAGDELQFSTLPERLSEMGHKVYLLKNSPEVHPPRNHELIDFIWRSNPYIVGEMEGDWNLGDLPTIPYKNTYDNFIMNWEFAFGLKPENILPVIYYEPKKIKDIYGLIELSSISLKYNAEKVVKYIQAAILPLQIPFKQIVNKHQSNPIIIPNVDTIEVNGLYNIYDHICSAEYFFSLSSGTHSMAAAARRVNPMLKHYCLLPHKDYDWTKESKKFVYPGIKYIDENGDRGFCDLL